MKKEIPKVTKEQMPNTYMHIPTRLEGKRVENKKKGKEKQLT